MYVSNGAHFLYQTKKQRTGERLWFSTTQKEEKEDLPPGKHFVSHQMAVTSKRFIPSNISGWAMSWFQEWKSARNRKSAEEDKRQCPEDLLENPDIHELNYWISRLVVKVQNKMGEPYPPPPLPPRTFIRFLQDYKGTCLPRILALQCFLIRVRRTSAKFVALMIPSIGISTQKK